MPSHRPPHLLAVMTYSRSDRFELAADTSLRRKKRLLQLVETDCDRHTCAKTRRKHRGVALLHESGLRSFFSSLLGVNLTQ